MFQFNNQLNVIIIHSNINCIPYTRYTKQNVNYIGKRFVGWFIISIKGNLQKQKIIMIKDIFQFSIKHIKIQVVLVFEHIKFTVLI